MSAAQVFRQRVGGRGEGELREILMKRRGFTGPDRRVHGDLLQESVWRRRRRRSVSRQSQRLVRVTGAVAT